MGLGLSLWPRGIDVDVDVDVIVHVVVDCWLCSRTRSWTSSFRILTKMCKCVDPRSR